MSAQWYIKAFSEMSGVSVRTLHHYDEIELLNPSIRMDNGYRLYSEGDLYRLKQILALRHFGFTLKKIKPMLDDCIDMQQELTMQFNCLIKDINDLQSSRQCLEHALASMKTHGQVDYNQIHQLMDDSNKEEGQDITWIDEISDRSLLQQFASLKKEQYDETVSDYENRWKELLDEISNNMDKPAESHIGQELAQEWLSLLNEINKLRNSNSLLNLHARAELPHLPISEESLKWINQAMKACKIESSE
jgi:DNA-binding transcriptional MerR regulator